MFDPAFLRQPGIMSLQKRFVKGPGSHGVMASQMAQARHFLADRAISRGGFRVFEFADSQTATKILRGEAQL
jgi:hypothetical protein